MKQAFSFFSSKNFLNVYGGEKILQLERNTFLTCRFQYKCTEKYVDLSESQCDKFLTITQTIFVYYLIFIIQYIYIIIFCRGENTLPGHKQFL